MSIEASYINTGLISQNYDVINRVNQKYAGRTAQELQDNSSGTLTEISEEEWQAIRQKQKNESKTLQADSSEIVNNFYSATKDTITYNVDGVLFTNAEMKACKEMIKSAISELPTKGSDLNYNDYASMGITANVVNRYAEQNLTARQAKIVVQSLEDYFDSLIDAEKERQKASGYLNADKGESADAVKYYSGCIQSASNSEYAETIKNLFQNADLDDEASLNEVLRQYRSLMTPAYQEYGLQNTGNSMSLTHVLNQDVNRFQICISNLKAAAMNIGNSVSYRI